MSTSVNVNVSNRVISREQQRAGEAAHLELLWHTYRRTYPSRAEFEARFHANKAATLADVPERK